MTRIAPTALYQEVAERLRQRIFAHELTPGDWIDEQKLAEQYGISRTPLREALKVLAAEGLVDLKPRRGCYVTEISRQDIDDIFPLMAMLEGRCAFIAVQLAKPEDIRDLKAIHEKLELAAKESRIDAFFEANQEFHRRIQELTNNRWLLSVIHWKVVCSSRWKNTASSWLLSRQAMQKRPKRACTTICSMVAKHWLKWMTAHQRKPAEQF